jgi:hypothetical protein
MKQRFYAAVAVLLACGACCATRAETPAGKKLDRWWADLGSKDPIRVDRAMTSLVARPAQTVAFLRKRLSPVPAADGRLVAHLLAELDHERFPVREKATRDLHRIGEVAEPALRRALANHPSPEARRRIERLLGLLRSERLSPPADRLRAVRAVEVLERIGSPAARRVLTALARGTPEAGLTVEARAALERLNQPS